MGGGGDGLQMEEHSPGLIRSILHAIYRLRPPRGSGVRPIDDAAAEEELQMCDFDAAKRGGRTVRIYVSASHAVFTGKARPGVFWGRGICAGGARGVGRASDPILGACLSSRFAASFPLRPSALSLTALVGSLSFPSAAGRRTFCPEACLAPLGFLCDGARSCRRYL